MDKKLTRADCLSLLQHKYGELNRLPKRADFDTETAAMIKSYFGPWPRALEAAGIKEVNARREEKKNRRRKRAKAARQEYRDKPKLEE